MRRMHTAVALLRSQCRCSSTNTLFTRVQQSPMAGLLKGLQELGAAVGRGTSLHGRVGFHAWKARAKMNKLSNAPSLMGHDQFGNAYYEDKTESFGRHRWIEYAKVNVPFTHDNRQKQGELAHTGTTDWGQDASTVPPEWHGWLHYMNDDVPSSLAGMDGKAVSYKAAHKANQTGCAGVPVAERYLPPWHRASRVYKGQAQEKVEAWVPPS